MNLHSAQCFWPLNSGLIHSYPSLDADLNCDILVIGAGITGALICDHLSQQGISVAVVDRRDVASGSTSASTAMLQYEIDTDLYELIRRKGKAEAERAYKLCAIAIDRLEAIANGLTTDCGFERKGSFYFASSAQDVASVEQEYAARRAAGFEVELWRSKDIAQRFNFKSDIGIYSHLGAQVDPYRLAHALIARAQENGARIFDRTCVTQIIQENNDGDFGVSSGVRILTNTGFNIDAKKVVVACGYEAHQFMQEEVVTLKSSYALITEPVTQMTGWYKQCLLWESARPYVYLRTTADNRIIIGGEDEPFQESENTDELLAKKQQILEKKLRHLMPDISFQVAYAWSGTFGETKDGLAYIGETPDLPNAYFALGYGGNGITYSVIAAEIISDLYKNIKNSDADIFRFGR